MTKDFTVQIKELKEKIKKKNDRIKYLNKKISELEEDLEHNSNLRRKFYRLYHAIRPLLPTKYYRITYNVRHTLTDKIISKYTEIEKGVHPSEVISELNAKYNPVHYIEMTDILELAS